MAVATYPRANGYLQRAPRSSGLADVLEILLDKGLVVDAYVRVSVVGIELLTVDARIVVASVDTYLRFAEAVNRLDLAQANGRRRSELAEQPRAETTRVARERPAPSNEDQGDDDSTLRTAVKGVAAAAAVGAAAAIGRELAARSNHD